MTPPVLRLTIADAAGQRDVLVRARSGTTWAQVTQADPTLPRRLYTGSDAVSGDYVVGSPPLVHGALLTLTPATIRPRHLLELRVVEGVDCGLTVPLANTEVTIGRAVGAVLRLTDPDISRHHVTVRLAAGLVTVADAGSTNGTRIDGAPVPPGRAVTMHAGSRLEVGRSRIELTRADRPERPVAADPPQPVTVPIPREPTTPEKRSWPLLLALVPLVVSAAAALLLRNPMFLIFALLSPVMVLTQSVSDRRGTSRGHRRALADYREAVARSETEVVASLDRERRIRELRSPSVGSVARLTAAARTAPGSRDPAAGLRVRLGRARIESAVGRRTESSTFAEAEHHAEPLPDAPVEVDLCAAGLLILTGPARYRLAQSLVVQLATWYPAEHVRIQVAAANADRWAWLRMLPHVLADPAGCPDIRPDVRRLPRATQQTAVVIIDGSPMGAPPGTIAVVLQEAARIDEGSTIIETMAAGTAVGHGLPGVLGPIYLDLLAPGTAERCARSLAATTDLSAQQGIPNDVSLDDLVLSELGVDVTDARQVQRQWTTGRDRMPLGRTASGAFWLDLPVDGPHALVAGTTGSGKSALLQTFLVAWAIGQPPDRLSFVLIDYKGGSAFSVCARLPHTVGLVTDLDAALTARALRSLQAEVRRREELLAAAGAADFAAYTALDPPVRLARLVIVIDEFRILAEDLPDFLQGLIRIAAVGRSLGIHLVLATQRAAGAVSADIRANVDVRIALRTTDRSDSLDVIGSDAAALLDPSTPGRAVVQVAGDRGTTVQIARVAARRAESGLPVVSPVDPLMGAPVVDAASSQDDMGAVVDRIQAAEVGWPAAPAHQPWLPPLPERVVSLDAPPGTVMLGLADLPDRQRQETVTWAAGDGNLLIVGGPASGRTTSLITIAAGDPAPAYYLGSSPPAVLQGYLQVGACVSFDEPARLHRLLEWLETRDSRSTGGPVRLLVDDWDGLQQRTDIGSVAVVDRILTLLREGPRSGLMVAVAGGRAVVSGRVGSLARRRICLTSAGADDLLLLGVRPDRTPTTSVPGRGVVLPEGHEVQCALPLAPMRDLPAALRFNPLPVVMDRATLPAGAIGCGLDGPIHLTPEDRWLLIAGPAGSGRTTALAAIANAVAQQGDPCAWLGGDTDCAGVDHFGVDDWEGLTVWLRQHPAGALCIDDVDQWSGAPLEQLIGELAGRCRIAGSASGASAASAYAGVLGQLRRAGSGILLQPSRRDGEVLGVALPTSYDEGPGSGVIVRRGRVTQVRIGRYQDSPR